MVAAAATPRYRGLARVVAGVQAAQAINWQWREWELVAMQAGDASPAARRA